MVATIRRRVLSPLMSRVVIVQACARVLRPSLRIVLADVGTKTLVTWGWIPHLRLEKIRREAPAQVANSGGRAGWTPMVFLVALTAGAVCWTEDSGSVMSPRGRVIGGDVGSQSTLERRVVLRRYKLRLSVRGTDELVKLVVWRARDIGETAPYVSVKPQRQFQGPMRTRLLSSHRLPVVVYVLLPLHSRKIFLDQDVAGVELLRDGVLLRRGRQSCVVANRNLDRILDLLSRLDGGVVIKRARRLGNSCSSL